VFRNLIDNALSFSPEGGVVQIRAHRGNGAVVVTIDDDGPGIPPGKEEAIFDRFYSERPEGEAFGAHSGLGLSISRQIIEAHRGRIRAANREGPAGQAIGARFIVELPAGT
jgi:two-component system sensor histidine kinase ChvG